MPTNLFDLYANLGLDSREYEAGLNKAQRTATQALSAIDTTMTAGIAAAASAVTAFGGVVAKVGLSYNAQIESATADFEVLLGDYDKAAKKINQLRQISSKTPFELTDLTKATKTLLAFNVDADATVGILQQLGDISLGDANKLDSLARAFGKMNASQKVTLEDINIMITAGFNPLLKIAETTGETMTDLYSRLSKGGVAVSEITDAFDKATSAGGQFYKGMERASQTTKGLMSTLKDNLNTVAGTLVKPFSDVMQEQLLPAFIEDIGIFQKWLDDNPEKLNQLADILNSLATKGIDLVINGMQWLIDNADDIDDKIVKFTSTIAACYGTVKLLAGLLTGNYFEAFIGGSVLAVTAVGNLLKAFRDLKKEAELDVTATARYQTNLNKLEYEKKWAEILQDPANKYKTEAELEKILNDYVESLKRGIAQSNDVREQLRDKLGLKQMLGEINSDWEITEQGKLTSESLVNYYDAIATAVNNAAEKAKAQIDEANKVAGDASDAVDSIYDLGIPDYHGAPGYMHPSGKGNKSSDVVPDDTAEKLAKTTQMINTLSQSMGDFFTQLYEGEDAWTAFGNVALNVLSQVLQSLGAQLAAMAATKALMGNWGGAALATAGAVAAYGAAGVTSSMARSITSSIPSETATASSQPIILEVDGQTLGKFTYDAYNKQNRRVGVSIA